MRFFVLIFTLLVFQTFGQIQVEKASFDEFNEAVLSHNDDTTYVINFWATWCKPCVAELPDFVEAQKQIESDQVKFVFVSLDFPDNEKRVNGFVNAKGIAGVHYLLNETDANVWIDKIEKEWDGVIPATFIIRKSKNHQYFHKGTMNLTSLKEEINKSLEL